MLLFVAFFENLNTTQNSIGYGIIQRPFARSWSQSSLHYFASIALLCFYQAVTTSEYVKGWPALPYAQSYFLCMFLSALCELGLGDPDVNNVGEFLFRDMNEYTLNIRRQD